MSIRWFAGALPGMAVVNPASGEWLPGDTGAVWDAETGGTRIVDLLDANGEAIPDGTIFADANGYPSRFGIDTDPETEVVYVDFTGGLGARVRLECLDRVTFHDGTPAADAAAASAAAAATDRAAAEAAAGLATAPTDTAMAAKVNDAASQTRAALDGRYSRGPFAGKHPLTGYYHVDGFGALGTGDDQPTILAAHNAAVTAGGGTVYFADRTGGYQASAFTIPNSSNVRWLGDKRVKLQKVGASAAGFINLTTGLAGTVPTSNFTLENLTIDPAGGTSTGTVRLFSGVNKVAFTNCAFTDSGSVGGQAVIDVLTGASEPTMERCTVYNTPIAVGNGTATFTAASDLVTTPAAHGLVVGDVVQFATIVTTTGITAGEFYFVKTVPTSTTLTLSYGFNSTALDLTGDGSGTGLVKSNALGNVFKLGANVAKPTFSRNVVTGWKDRVFWALSAGTSATVDAVVEANHISAMIPGGQARQPITFQGVDTAMHLRPTVRGNTVLGASESYNDTILRGTADLISLHRCKGGEVSGNKVWYGGDVGITIALQCVGINVFGNNAQFNDTVGICIGSGITTYCRDHAIGPNVCKNNGQGRTVSRPYRVGILFQKAGQCTVVGGTYGDDQGSTTVASSVTFTDAGDLVTTPTPHGLVGGHVVKFASVTGTTGITANTPYYVRNLNLTATSFQLSATGSNGAPIALTTNGTGGAMTRPGTQTHGIAVLDSADITLPSGTFNGNLMAPYSVETSTNTQRPTLTAA